MANPEMNLLVIRSADIDGSVAFYEKLGISFNEERHGQGPRHFAAILGKLVFEIYPLGKRSPTTDIRLGFAVESLDAVITAINDDLAVVSQPQQTEYGYSATVRDPDEHVIDLTEQD